MFTSRLRATTSDTPVPEGAPLLTLISVMAVARSMLVLVVAVGKGLMGTMPTPTPVPRAACSPASDVSRLEISTPGSLPHELHVVHLSGRGRSSHMVCWS